LEGEGRFVVEVGEDARGEVGREFDPRSSCVEREGVVVGAGGRFECEDRVSIVGGEREGVAVEVESEGVSAFNKFELEGAEAVFWHVGEDAQIIFFFVGNYGLLFPG